MGRFPDVDRYIAQCGKLDKNNDWHRYSLFVHGYLLPTLERQRVVGEISQGRFAIIIRLEISCRRKEDYDRKLRVQLHWLS